MQRAVCLTGYAQLCGQLLLTESLFLAQGLDLIGHHFLATAGRPEDEHGGVCRSDPLDDGANFRDLR